MNAADRSLLARIAALLEAFDPPPPEVNLCAAELPGAGVPCSPARPAPTPPARPDQQAR